MTRETVETTYADLRPSDLVIDKTGQAWPLDPTDIAGDAERVGFWLCDPASKVRMHYLTKPLADAVKVSRLPTQSDEAAKLEADFPKSSTLDGGEGSDVENVYANAFMTLEEAVAAVEEIGGTVEAEVTAEDVDAAAAATEDSPLTLPAFATMTPLEQRSHLYLLHGVYGHDLVSKAELGALHDEAHATPPQSRYVPHSHEVA
jgi:hypothetical protein